MIEKQQATVFYAPTKGRRYFTKSAAIKAEAKAIIYAKYPREPFEPDTGHSFDMATDCPREYDIMFRRMCRLIKSACETLPLSGESENSHQQSNLRVR